jgi:hypothetical protein
MNGVTLQSRQQCRYQRRLRRIGIDVAEDMVPWLPTYARSKVNCNGSSRWMPTNQLLSAELRKLRGMISGARSHRECWR